MNTFAITPGSSLKLAVLGLVCAAGIIACLLLPPIAQDPLYHEFADRRSMFGIPHFWNTITNLPFLLVGLFGLGLCAQRAPRGGLRELRCVYAAFFVGIALVSIGSAYYHLAPSTTALFWDRLPMSVAFMALFSAVVGENISPRLGRRLLAPLLTAGIASVLYWSVTEGSGQGDLRPYALVQFLPLVLIPLILMMYGSALTSPGYVWAIVITYALAKVAEFFDAALLDATGILSGHSIKHLLAGLATLWMLLALVRRRPVNPA